MVYKWVPPHALIERLEFTYGVKAPEYIQLLPLWIHQGLKALRVRLPLEPICVQRTIKNNIVELPDDMSVLSIMTLDGKYIPRVGRQLIKTIPATVYNQFVSDTVDAVAITKDEEVVVSKRSIPASRSGSITFPTGGYVLHHNGLAEFTFDADKEYIIDIYYLRMPTMTDEYTGIRVPMIPDAEAVIENLTWLVLQNLMYRGYKHKVLNINSNNPLANPASMYMRTKGAARNSVLSLDGAAYSNMEKIWTSVIPNVDYVSRNFNI